MTTEAQQMSEEDKFFGVRTPVVVKDEGTADDGDSGDNLNIEVVEDLPVNQQPQANAAALSDDEGEDDELTSYSAGVQKRIKKLTFQREEAKRQMGEATLMREEAIRVAKQLSDQNRYQANQLSVGEAQLVDRTKAAAGFAVNEAKAHLTKAHESGDTEGMVAAQQSLNAAQYQLQKATDYEYEFNGRRQQQQSQQPQQPQQPQIRPQQQQQQTPAPEPRAAEWAKENPWFGNDEHKDMTALAYGVHEQLIKNEGVTPNTEAYYTRINTEMRSRFPEYFEGSQNVGDGSGRQPVSPSRRPTQVVAPGNRNNGAKPRTVKLTSTAVALAKRLGITPEQYANQLAKEMK